MNKIAVTTLVYSLMIRCFFIGEAQAAERAEIRIIDQEGNPVQNVVLSTRPSAEQVTEPFKTDSVAVMDQIGKQFLPKVLVVQRGQQVVFPNSDDIRHHVYSFSKPKVFEIKMYKGGESEVLLFDRAGIVVLGCNIHDDMVGYIYVADNEATAITDSNGRATLNMFESVVYLWHPRLSVSRSERQQFSLDLSGGGNRTLQITLLPTKNTPSKSGFKSKFGDKAN